MIHYPENIMLFLISSKKDYPASPGNTTNHVKEETVFQIKIIKSLATYLDYIHTSEAAWSK